MVAPFFKVLHAQFIPQSPEYPATSAVYIALNRKPMTRVSRGMESGRWLVRLLVLLAATAVAIGTAEWLNPSPPPYRGRLAWVADAAVYLVGATGLALLWFALGVALVVLARFVWRHTPKVPSDRWLW